ncbi:hypothetical protein HMPREF2534_03987 [Bacteroides thetaiotaomicron]|nr:hypothetical protein HMPREF2534_03987 [Bacteroides thetaiotaomicron]
MRRLCYGRMKQILQSYYIPLNAGIGMIFESFYGICEEKPSVICYLCVAIG